MAEVFSALSEAGEGVEAGLMLFDLGPDLGQRATQERAAQIEGALLQRAVDQLLLGNERRQGSPPILGFIHRGSLLPALSESEGGSAFCRAPNGGGASLRSHMPGGSAHTATARAPPGPDCPGKGETGKVAATGLAATATGGA